jgi:hypothetical protein
MIVKFEFRVGTRYVGSTVKDTLEFDIDDDATEEEIEEIANEAWRDWMNNEIDGGWKRI